MLKAALYYLEKLKYSIIPVNKDKKPAIKWQEYQNRLPTTEEIKKWFTKPFNIALVTGAVSGVCVIDIDDMDKGTAKLKELGVDIDTIQTPKQSTPRGGMHLLFQCPDDQIGNTVNPQDGIDFRGNGGYAILSPSVNGNGKEYKWIIKPTTVSLLSLSLYPLLLLYIKSLYIYKHINRGGIIKGGEKNLVTSCYNPLHSVTFFEKGRRDEDLFHIANSLIKGGAEKEITRKTLEILAVNCKPPFEPSEIQIKIDSAMDRESAREKNITEDLKNLISVTNGYISVTSCYNSLHCVTKQEKVAVRVGLHRLYKAGVLERLKEGYRKIDTTLNKIDISISPEEPLYIKYPFAIQKFISTYQKNIITIAGSPDAGKTAFLLNFAKLNMDRHKVNYFSSEMGDNEIRTRLSKFADIKIADWSAHFFERAKDYADVIEPDAINIVDYMEIYENHYLIGQWIKDIHDKLKSGICLIAIQKKRGVEMGVGGNVTLEKPRLYLTMEGGVIKIQKAKNWLNPERNPNGLQLKYKLIAGCEFKVMEDWSYENS